MSWSRAQYRGGSVTTPVGRRWLSVIPEGVRTLGRVRSVMERMWKGVATAMPIPRATACEGCYIMEARSEPKLG